MKHHPTNIASELAQTAFAIEEFGGACDPDFDNDLEELERQFAELASAWPASEGDTTNYEIGAKMLQNAGAIRGPQSRHEGVISLSPITARSKLA